MLGYHRKFILNMKSILNEIKSDPDKINLLYDFQIKLIRKILYIEKHIKRLKDEIKILKSQIRSDHLSKNISQKKKLEVNRKNKRIEDYKWFLFILKSFGDSIAHIYLDTFSIKQLFYNTDNYEVKESAGFLLGKEGTAYEIALLKSAIDHGVPALLCDLTNSLRHGDVCLLGADDPFLIEVKASNDQSLRGKRQARAINKLHTFFAEDYSNELHADMIRNYESFVRAEGVNETLGLAQTHRQEVPRMRNHAALLNAALNMLKDRQADILYPEAGVRYFVSRKGYDNKKIKEFCTGLKRVYPFSWNETKNSMNWYSYIPFTLLIEEPENLYDFLVGDLFIMVLVDLDKTIEALSINGISANLMTPGESYIFRCKHEESEAVFMISEHLFQRVCTELLCLEDFVSFSTSSLPKKLLEMASNTQRTTNQN